MTCCPSFCRQVLLLLSMAAALVVSRPDLAGAVGRFGNHQDIGPAPDSGTGVRHDPASDTYTVTGAGENMWFDRDAFHFVWTKLSGDLAIEADITWLTSTGDPHRKAGLIIRQGLEANAAYADAVLHGDGLTSFQFRETNGAPTREIQAGVSHANRLRLERVGNVVSMSVATGREAFRPAGGSFHLDLRDPIYVGLAVCAHNSNALATARFSNVRIEALDIDMSAAPVLESTLETIDIRSKDRRALYSAAAHFEAPNWSPDGKYFLFNQQGRIYRLENPPAGPPQALDTGFATRCNNDHGISPDERWLVISDHTEQRDSIIYRLPIQGGVPVRVTEHGPSYWHGYSPDGATLAFCAERDGEFDIYTIPVAGGSETRLTSAGGLDDGPDYSPDGRFIYFNSDRTGAMKIWRMRSTGEAQEQLTSDEWNDWFPHPSPDGRWIVFLSYHKDVKGHPANEHVVLRLMPATGGPPEIIAKIFGGQGTINVPSWSPDSRHVAFVSYRQVFRSE